LDFDFKLSFTEELVCQQLPSLNNVAIVSYPNTLPQLTNHNLMVFQSSPASYLLLLSLQLPHFLHFLGSEKMQKNLALMKLSPKEDHCFLFYPRVNQKLLNQKISRNNLVIMKIIIMLIKVSTAQMSLW
jgi:hypothetical protein